MSRVEILGICASVVILISGMMKGEKKLRAVDAVGSLMMTIYGVLLGAFSVWFLNGALAIAHLYRLWQLKRTEKKEPDGTL